MDISAFGVNGCRLAAESSDARPPFTAERTAAPGWRSDAAGGAEEER
jgi:hypothetical protein